MPGPAWRLRWTALMTIGDSSLAQRAAGGTLSPAARAAVEAGVPAETRKAYQDDIRQYQMWCAELRQQPFPCSADRLTEYATYLTAGAGVAPGSVERARWAIVKHHRLAGQTPPDTSGLVAVLKGYRAYLAETKDPKASPHKATPAGKDTLAEMMGALDRTRPKGRRDAAVILLGFAIGARRSELAGLDIGSIAVSDRGIQVEVYRKKTRLMDSPVVRFQPNTVLCPARATVRWIEYLAQCGRASGPLFVRIDRWRHLAPQIIRDGRPIGDSAGRLTGQAVGDIIRSAALTAALEGRWTGHSLRRGLATSMHEAGHDRRLIERQGGWTAGSKAVSGYIDDADRWLYDVLDGVL